MSDEITVVGSFGSVTACRKASEYAKPLSSCRGGTLDSLHTGPLTFANAGKLTHWLTTVSAAKLNCTLVITYSKSRKKASPKAKKAAPTKAKRKTAKLVPVSGTKRIEHEEPRILRLTHEK